MIAEQQDAQTRGWWKDDQFYLATTLDRQGLEDFFLYQYAPTPLVAPWNGGSGFFPKDNQSGIAPLEASTASRFDRYRTTIQTARKIVQSLGAKPVKGGPKNSVIANCRRAFQGGAADWLEAAIAIDGSGECSFPAMLGTGGNDGRLDFTSNFMQRLVSLFDVPSPTGVAQPKTTSQLHAALWLSAGPNLESGAIGQFYPGAAGGPNGSTGFTGSVKVNPWDYVLMLEGAIAFRSGLSRRCANTRLPQAAAPFAVRASGAGYGSCETVDAGPRGEQWMPIWNHPATHREISHLLREGKAQIDGKNAQRGIELARSVARLGTARGIKSFERYGYIERNGLANLAVPLGRFNVRDQPNQNLLSEVMPYIDRLRRIAADKNAPESFRRCHLACENAAFDCTRSPRGQTFLRLLIALSETEEQFLKSRKFASEKMAQPVPPLTNAWLSVINADVDGTEYRLARALALQTTIIEKAMPFSIRHHWLPLEKKYGRQFANGEGGLRVSPEQCALGLDLENAAIEIVKRRLLQRTGGPANHKLPLRLMDDSHTAKLSDIQAFLEFRVDDGRVLAMARGLMAIRVPSRTDDLSQHGVDKTPLAGLAAFGLLRLAHPTNKFWMPGIGSVDVRCNRTVFIRLAAGDLIGASQIAVRQLSIAGLRPRIRMTTGSAQYARRLAASMVFGIAPGTLRRLATGLTAPEIPAQAESSLRGEQ